MSKDLGNAPNTPHPKVIVRAWGDEPVVLVAHGLDQGTKRVFVGQPEAKRPISLPTSDVFDYSPGRFNELSAAFRARDKNKLRRLYKNLHDVEKSCNRYQIMLSSQHENEPKITDSGSAAGSGQQ